MTRRRKIILGALTAWPLLYIFLFVAFIASMMIAGPLMGEPGANEAFGGLMAGGFGLVFIGHIGTMLLQFGLLFFFLFHVFKREDLETNTQLLWALLIFMGGPIGQMIYWWKEIWSADEARPATTGPSDEFSGTARHGGRDGML
ncbi:MAG: hypothetical protein ACQEVA_12955 [Myxococcota bacterium]